MPTAVMTGIEREHGVERDDLRHHHGRSGVLDRPVGAGSLALDPFVQFHRRLEQQEQAAQQQDQVAPRKAMLPRLNRGAVSVTIQEIMVSRPTRISIASDRPSRRARSRCSGRQLFREDGDEDQVVDAENDLENDERKEPYPAPRWCAAARRRTR
jgi:hypothetical protein